MKGNQNAGVVSQLHQAKTAWWSRGVKPGQKSCGCKPLQFGEMEDGTLAWKYVFVSCNISLTCQLLIESVNNTKLCYTALSMT